MILNMAWVSILRQVSMVIIGLFILGIALWGFIAKRPLIFPASYPMWLMAVFIAPIFLLSISLLLDVSEGVSGGDLTLYCFIPLILLASCALLIYIVWRQSAGYAILGVSGEAFRRGLTGALNRLNLPFEENLSNIRLLSLKADLQATAQDWMGTAQMRIKPVEQAVYLEDIVKAMNEYYQTNPVKLNTNIFVIQLLMGIFVVAFPIITAI